MIHDDLDAIVADAYGLPALSDRIRLNGPALAGEEFLRRLVARRVATSFGGRSTPCLSSGIQHSSFSIQRFLPALAIADKPTAGKAKKAERVPWPKTLAEQAQAVRSALAARPKPATAGELCKQFKSAKAERVAELLATLAALGQARPVGGERFVA